MVNTEKPTTKQEAKKNLVATPKENKQKITKTPIAKQENKKTEETKKQEDKKPIQKKPVNKKEFAEVNSKSLPVSTKTAKYICTFIKGKKIDKAIENLEAVIAKKKAIPMKGEIPHRKGKIMSGRFPKNAAQEFIIILKGLKGNSLVNGLEEPVISEAVANMASRPFGRGGRHKKKRTHVKLVARELKKNKKEKKK
jgi:large subunit ribosomal protein L22